MRLRFLSILAVFALGISLSACSASGDESPGAASDPTAQAPAGGDADNAPNDDADTDEDDDGANADTGADADTGANADIGNAPADISGQGTACDVLIQLYDDIVTLPAKAENPGITDEDVELIMGPAEAMKDDLPGMVGMVLPILRNDVNAATVSNEEDMLEYFDRGTHDQAVDALVSSARTACNLGEDWPAAS